MLTIDIDRVPINRRFRISGWGSRSSRYNQIKQVFRLAEDFLQMIANTVFAAEIHDGQGEAAGCVS